MKNLKNTYDTKAAPELHGNEAGPNQRENLFHSEECVKSVSFEKIQGLLNITSANLPRQAWFSIAAFLKRNGCSYEIFRKWSMTAPEKFNEADCIRVWQDAAADNAEPVTIASLIKFSKEYPEKNHLLATASKITSEVLCCGFIPAPDAMLPVPETDEERSKQACEFLFSAFREGECFELVTRARKGKNGHFFPARSKNSIMEDFHSLPKEERIKRLRKCISSSQSGIWVSTNPVIPGSRLSGFAPHDNEITDYRTVLLEADEGTKEEQWAIIHGLSELPIDSVVWSGGKSMHVRVRIDAGKDPALFKRRVSLLYKYVREKGFNIDLSNSNPSRLTRLPGCQRGNDTQYLVSGPFGAPSWDVFENWYHNQKLPEQTPTEPSPQITSSVTDDEQELIKRVGNPCEISSTGKISSLNERFFAKLFTTHIKPVLEANNNRLYMYDAATGLWIPKSDEEMLEPVMDFIEKYAQAHNLVGLVAKFTAPKIRNIISLIKSNSSQEKPFERKQVFIHVSNGVLELNKGAWELKPFSRITIAATGLKSSSIRLQRVQGSYPNC